MKTLAERKIKRFEEQFCNWIEGGDFHAIVNDPPNLEGYIAHIEHYDRDYYIFPDTSVAIKWWYGEGIFPVKSNHERLIVLKEFASRMPQKLMCGTM